MGNAFIKEVGSRAVPGRTRVKNVLLFRSRHFMAASLHTESDLFPMLLKK